MGGGCVWGNGHLRSMTINLGVAGAVHEMVALGGQLLTLSRSRDEVGRGNHYDVSNNFLSGEAGLLVVTPAQVNLGLTWRSGDSNDETFTSYRAMGINETLKVGAAYQKKEGNWLVGAEYVHRRELPLEEPVYYATTHGFEEELQFGGKRIHFYGEYGFEKICIRAGLCLSSTDKDIPHYDDYTEEIIDYEFDTERLIVSFGISGRFSDHVGWDLFLQRATGDRLGRSESYDWVVYDYEDESLRIGFGLTIVN